MRAIFGIIATPMGYVMEYIYRFLHSYGYSIVAFALLAKMLLLPLSIKQKRSMIVSQRLQPKLLALQKRYANNQEKYAQEMQKLYDEADASPMSGCGTSLLTLPIMLGLYYVVVMPLTYFMHLTSTEVAAVASALDVSTTRFGYELTLAGMLKDNMDALSSITDKLIPVSFVFYGLDLAATPSFKHFSVLWVLPVLSALTSMLFSWVSQKCNEVVLAKEVGPSDEKAQQMNFMMMILMPLMSGYFGFVLPGAVSLYWIANNLFSAGQEILLTWYCLKTDKTEKKPLSNTKAKKLQNAQNSQKDGNGNTPGGKRK